MGPHLETWVPMGTFFSLLSLLGPIRSPFVQILMTIGLFCTLFIFLMNDALFVIHSIIHSTVQQKYSFKKFIHSKKHANYSFKEFIHSKKIQNYSFKKFIHSKKIQNYSFKKFIHSKKNEKNIPSKNLFIKKNPKLFIQKKYSFKWKMDYRPGLLWEALLAKIWWEEAQKHFNGPGRRPLFSLGFQNCFSLQISRAG